MIDVNAEIVLPLAVLAREITNRTGERGINVATAWRWCMKTNRHGVKLESVIVGGIRMSSREAVARYIQATTAAASGETITARWNAQRRREVEDAAEELKSPGI